MDDPGAAVALPALGNLRHRQRAAGKTAWRAVVLAVAVRALARRQRALARFAAGLFDIATLPRTELRQYRGIGSMLLREETKNALENQPPRSRPPADRSAGRACSPCRHCRRIPLFHAPSEAARYRGFHCAEPKRALVIGKRFRTRTRQK